MSESEPNYITVDMHMPDGRVVSITGTYHDELAALIQEAASASGEDDFNAEKAYSDVKAAIERNYQAMLDAGHSEAELAGLNLADLMNGEWVAQQLQGEAGNGPVGDKLVRQIVSCTPKGQSVRITEMLTSMSHTEIYNVRNGKTAITVDKAAQLAVAYGVTTGELLGIVDADEVKLLRLWRGMDERKRECLLGLLT